MKNVGGCFCSAAPTLDFDAPTANMDTPIETVRETC
jgi:hypothetical protein